MHYETWSSFTEATLRNRDIAQLNLAAACGLPFTESLSVPELCAQVDDWAGIVEHATTRMYRQRSRYMRYSDAQFRIMALITVLQRDLGVHYNLAFSEGEYDASDSRNLFLHGVLTGRGGTCVTLPVLYVAIGRRLGYPLFLVRAMEHLFCRWEGQGDRFNIEATSPGFVSHADSWYLQHPKPLTEHALLTGRFLRNLNRVEEVALFAIERGNCCLDNLWTWGAYEAYATSEKLAPDPATWDDVARTVLIHRFLAQQMPALIGPMPRNARYCDIPVEFEQAVLPSAKQWLARILRNRERRPQAAFPPKAAREQLLAAIGTYYA
jgi:hypothetical protein